MVNHMLAGSFAVRQSKTILARSGLQTRIATMGSVLLRTREEKLTAFVELESATRLLE
jgi:hypothetical protein